MFHFNSIQYGENVHDRLVIRPPGFEKIRKSTLNIDHELVIAVQQNQVGLQKLELILDDISSPNSAKYQNWLSFDEVTKLVINTEATESVLSWLNNSYTLDDDGNKVFAKVTWQSLRGEYIKATAPIAHWNKVLHTEYYEFSHQQKSSNGKVTQRTVHRAEDYKLPAHLEKHVFAVFNTVQAPPPLNQRYHVHPREENISPSRNAHLRGDDGNDTASVANDQSTNPVTVAFLNKLYKIPSNKGSSNQYQSVFQTSNEYYFPGDLTSFQQAYGLHVQAATAANGNVATTASVCNTFDCAEGNLDVQYISGISQYTNTIFWYEPGASNNPDPFVAWITAISSSSSPPLSNSISWSSLEYYMTATVMKAFNTEALKVASMGVTVVVASGDDGAPNSFQKSSTLSVCGCSTDSSSSNHHNYWTQNGGGGAGTSETWSGKGYFPNYPASCPYVTTVGATMGPETGGSEIACQSQNGGVISSGGGFSTYFAAPRWQSKAVANYLSSVNLTSGFNPYGRAYPDVSLLGTNYQVYIAGKVSSLYGTSASAPVFAGFVSLINAARIANGKPSVGFMNPTLYAMGYNQTASSKAKYNDITVGNNMCCSTAVSITPTCCSSGFTAAVGWDPVTGWGSVNFPALEAVYNTSSAATTTSAAPSVWNARQQCGQTVLLIAFLLLIFYATK